MSTTPIYSSRYNNLSVKKLVQDLQNTHKVHQDQKTMQIQRERRTHQSCCEMKQRQKSHPHPEFNNKTHNDSKLFTQNLNSVPYMYLPKQKHDNLIIPDRAFARGKAGKRFFIKMKDTSVFSFRNQDQDQQTKSLLNKVEKEKTIISRKLEEMERIIDKDDGKIKAQNNKWFMLNRRTFRPPSNVSDLFSRVDPIMEPKDAQSLELKKISLTRTFSKEIKWRPATRRDKPFSATVNVGTNFFSRTDMSKKRTSAT